MRDLQIPALNNGQICGIEMMPHHSLSAGKLRKFPGGVRIVAVNFISIMIRRNTPVFSGIELFHNLAAGTVLTSVMSDCGLFPIPIIGIIVIQQRAFYSEMPRLCVRTLPHVKIFCHNGKHTPVCGIKFIRLFRKILAFFLQGIAETGFAGTGYAALGFVPAE